MLTIEVEFTENARVAVSANRIEQNIIYDIRLFNAQGVVVRQQQTKTGKIEFNVTNLPEGTYFLHIERNGQIQKEQITVERR